MARIPMTKPLVEMLFVFVTNLLNLVISADNQASGGVGSYLRQSRWVHSP